MKLIPISMLLLASGFVFAETDVEHVVRTLVVGDHADIEYVGPNLQAEIEALPDNCSIQVVLGDASSPIGDGEASHHAIVECGTSDGLGLRLKALDGNKFRVLGFWSLPGT